MKNRLFQIAGLVILLLASLIQAVPAMAAGTKTVTDLTGKKVKVPDHVNRVADLWHANNQVVLLLGGQKKLVATTPVIKKNYWFNQVDPSIKKVKAPFAGDQVQIEELVKLKPDVVITANPAQAKVAQEAHLPVINAMYTDFAGLKKSVTLTANVLGGDAPRIAKEYNHELDSNIKTVQKRLRNIKKKPKVVHFVNATDLTKVDGQKTIVDEWIKLAGGQNVIKKTGNQLNVTSEELVKANPDVIFVGSASTKEARQALKQNEALKSLPAVKNNRVYGNPQGTFPWDRYSAEEVLQVLWAAQKLHPQAMKGINMVEETQDFYQRYYHYRLTNKQAKQILAGNAK